MKLTPTTLPGVMVAKTTYFTDHRGAFARLYCERELASVIGKRHIVQINYSRTTAVGAVRGLHFQCPPHAEMKLVRCIRGRVWDVAVDLRARSPTLFRWHAEEITPENAHMVVIPEGCAHGFQALEPDSELLYLHTAAYAPESEGGISHNDPRLAITWPLSVTDISKRDNAFPLIDADFIGIPA